MCGGGAFPLAETRCGARILGNVTFPHRGTLVFGAVPGRVHQGATLDLQEDPMVSL